MARQGRLFAMACLVLAMALWGSSFIALKFAFAELPPMWVIFGRMALGSLVFLLAWRWRGRLDYRPGDWRYLLALAACEPCLYFIFQALALQHTSATQAGMITALLPLLVAVGAFTFLRERVALSTWAGFLLAVLAAEKLIRPLPGKQRVHELVEGSDFQARMDKLVASNASLPDDAAKTKPKLPAKPKAVKVDLSKRKPGRPSAKKPAARKA